MEKKDDCPNSFLFSFTAPAAVESSLRDGLIDPVPEISQFGINISEATMSHDESLT